MRNGIRWAGVCVFFTVLAFAGRGGAAEQVEPKALFEKRCSKCHGLEKTQRTGKPDWWKGVVRKMKEKWFSGISDEEAEIITRYLIENRIGK
ncbi:MAG: hypothetical protein JW821_18760 [Deltaproteobacteria bacterium]|nr:hypothetical protein [Deltaproteobacteria bacterium]